MFELLQPFEGDIEQIPTFLIERLVKRNKDTFSRGCKTLKLHQSSRGMSDAAPLPAGAPTPAAPPPPVFQGAVIPQLMGPTQVRQGIASSPPPGAMGGAASGIHHGGHDPTDDRSMEGSAERNHKMPQSRLVFKLDKPDGLQRMLEIAQVLSPFPLFKFHLPRCQAARPVGSALHSPTFDRHDGCPGVCRQERLPLGEKEGRLRQVSLLLHTQLLRARLIHRDHFSVALHPTTNPRPFPVASATLDCDAMAPRADPIPFILWRPSRSSSLAFH